MSRIQNPTYEAAASGRHPAGVNRHSGPRLSGHLPALDALRGVAVLLVFLFHADTPGFSGAFIGVDIFFVISGFLITVLLLQEHQDYGGIGLRHFYMRRLFRLMPALFLMLAVFVTFCYWYFPDPAEQLRHFQDALMVLFYAANWTRAFDLHRPAVLGHCWSLSVEEQFYMLWPLILLGIIRLPDRRRFISIAVLFVLPWIWRIYLLSQGASWDRVYNGFDCRADMVLAGCMLASLWNAGKLSWWGGSRFPASLFAAAAALALAAFGTAAAWEDLALYRWQYPAIALAAGAVILDVINRPGGALARFFSLPVLVGLGAVSYGFYLWHYPVIYFVSLNYPGAWAVWISAALTLFFTLFSWYCIERPALGLKKKFNPGVRSGKP